MVGGGDDALPLHPEGIVGLRALLVRKAEAGTELDALDRRDGEGQVSELALHAVEIGFTHACGQAQNGGLQHAAHTVALGTGGTDGSFHGFLHTAVQQGKALGLVQQCLGLRRQRGGIVLRKGGIADPGTPPDVSHDLDPGPVQGSQHQSAARHQRGGDAARKVAAAPGILIAVVLGVGSVIRVAGPQQVSRFGIVAAAGVLVFDHQGNGGASGAAVDHAG